MRDLASKIAEDARHSGYKLGAKSTKNVIDLLEMMAIRLESLERKLENRQ